MTISFFFLSVMFKHSTTHRQATIRRANLSTVLFSTAHYGTFTSKPQKYRKRNTNKIIVLFVEKKEGKKWIAPQRIFFLLLFLLQSSVRYSWTKMKKKEKKRDQTHFNNKHTVPFPYGRIVCLMLGHSGLLLFIIMFFYSSFSYLLMFCVNIFVWYE